MEEPTKPLRNDDLTAGILDQPRQPEKAKIGPAGRLFGVLLSPSETFLDIKQKPTWVVPLVLSMVLGIAFVAFFNWRVKPDWVTFTKTTLEKRAEKTGTTLSPEDAQAQAERALPFYKVFGYVVSIIYPALSALVFCGCIALGMLLVQGDITFKRIFSVYLWASCAIFSVVFQLVLVATLMAKDSAGLAQIDLRNPAGFAATNLGILLPADASPALKSLAGSADLFSVGLLIVLAIGFAKVSGSKKMTVGKAAAVTTTVWVVFVLIKAGLASLGG